MPDLSVRPQFGKPRMAPAYYLLVDDVIRNLRPTSTLRAIADALTEQGYRTPAGHAWSRQMVSTYVRNRNI